METHIKADPSNLDRIAQVLTGLKFQGTHIPMWVFDRKTLQFLAVNRAAIAHYGFSEEEFLGMSILDIRPAENVRRLVHETMCPHGHNAGPEVWRHCTKEGRAFPVQITAHQLEFSGREAELVVARELRATLDEFAQTEPRPDRESLLGC